MPSLTGSRRRHSGKPSSQSKKAGHPAPLSITSNHSHVLSSAPTTPSDIFHSSLRPSKRLGPTGAGRTERPIPRDGQVKSTGPLKKDNVDVFAFMERDDQSDCGSEASDEPTSESSPPSSPNSMSNTPRMVEMPQKSPRYSDLEVRTQQSAPRTWSQGSLHSDSGISVRSHSSDQDSPSVKEKYPLEYETPRIGIADCEQGDDPQTNALQVSPNCEAETPGLSHRHWPSLSLGGSEADQLSSPQWFNQHAAHNNEDLMPEMQARSASSLVPLEMHRQRESQSAVPVCSPRGYDLLASNIDSRNDALLKPIYRKFEILNNRMLLYLQDEIAQMEEDLKELDAAIAIEEVGPGRQKPVSRRLEAKMPSQLQWHRMDLMGRTFAKVEQYNRALKSYSDLTKSLEPASHQDIATYRAWIAQHTPVAEQESRFLDKEADLLSVTPDQASTTTNPPKDPVLGAMERKALEETPVVVVAFALVSTIIVFKVVPRILGRLLLSAMVGFAALAILYPRAMTSMRSIRELGRGIAIYSSVMFVLSVVVG